MVFHLQGQSLNGASFTSVEQLQEHIDAFISAYNETATPFAWTKKRVYQDDLQIAVSLAVIPVIPIGGWQVTHEELVSLRFPEESKVNSESL